MFYGILGVILGGRLGSVLFYNLPYYLDHPLDVIKVWQGGMSFHGGLLGVAHRRLALRPQDQQDILRGHRFPGAGGARRPVYRPA